MLLSGDGYQNPTKGRNTDYWFYMFEMEGAEKKNQPFLLNFDDKTNTIFKESEHQQLPLD